MTRVRCEYEENEDYKNFKTDSDLVDIEKV